MEIIFDIILLLVYISENIYEFFGVTFSFIYVIFSIRQNILCWPTLIIASIFNMIAFNAINLPLQMSMQFFFVATAIYGWSNWKKPNAKTELLRVEKWKTSQNIQWITIGLLITLLLTFFIKLLPSQSAIYSRYPFFDSLMFVFNIIPMYMTGRKILQCWIYFIVIDIISGTFYYYTEEYFYCLLFFGYIPFAITGLIQWKKSI